LIVLNEIGLSFVGKKENGGLLGLLDIKVVGVMVGYLAQA
jgi:hypothetical protein